MKPAYAWSLGGAVLLAAVVATSWCGGSVARDLERMAAPERAALYSRTLENLRTCGRRPTEALTPFCEEQAAFIRNFPECDDGCRALAREFSPRSTR